jgi:hypothetical protein
VGSLRQFWHRHEHGPGAGHAGLAVRSHVALHHAELDRDLAAGVAPGTSPEHTERARQLVGRHVRRELAGCIDGVLARVAHPPHWHSAALPIQAAAVQAARPELLALRDALLGDRCDSFRGVALAALLLHGETSPVYSPFAEPTVSAMARSATDALTAQPDGALPAD